MINNRYKIEQLIPQRYPMLLVDSLVSADDRQCITSYTVKDDAELVQYGFLTEPGIIEHMAQSASSLAGFKALENGATEPPLGMIGEVKNFHLFFLPRKGQQLRTEVEMGITEGDITNVTARTYAGERMIASSSFKIVIK